MNAFIFGVSLGQLLSQKGYDQDCDIPDFDKVSECFHQGLTVEQTVDLIIDQKWWHNVSEATTTNS